MGDERRQIIASVKEARGSGARLGPTCETMGISPRTYQRWNRPDNFCDRRPGARREPPNKLGEEERRKLLEVTNSPEYSDLPPCKIAVFFRGVVAYYVSLALTITSNNFHVKLFSVISSGFFAVIRVKPYLSYLRPVSRLT